MPRAREARATSTSRSRRCTPRRHRQDERRYLKDEAALARVRGRARGPQARDQPVQGSRRDGLRRSSGRRRWTRRTRTLLQVSRRGGRDRRRGVLDLMGDDVEARARRSSRRTPRTSASSTSDARSGHASTPDERTRTHARRRHAGHARRTSSRSRSRRRWSAPSSTTRCRSSPRARCPTRATG